MTFDPSDYESLDKGFATAMQLLFDVSQATNGIPNSNQSHVDIFESLTAKIFFHAATIFQLRTGTLIPFSSKEHPLYFDFPSAFVLARSLLETYLTVYRLFFDPKLSDDYIFDLAAWVIKGIAQRKDWNISRLDSDTKVEHQKTLASMDLWIKEIEKTSRYRQLSLKQRTSLCNGTLTEIEGGVQRNAKTSGLAGPFAVRLYSYYSGYTHADSIAGSQIAGSKTIDQQKNLYYTPLGYTIIIISNLAINYAQKWLPCKEVFDRNPEAATYVEDIAKEGRYLTF